MRYCGIYALSKRKTHLAKCREVLGISEEPESPPENDRSEKVLGEDGELKPQVCPSCGQKTLEWVFAFSGRRGANPFDAVPIAPKVKRKPAGAPPASAATASASIPRAPP